MLQKYLVGDKIKKKPFLYYKHKGTNCPTICLKMASYIVYSKMRLLSTTDSITHINTTEPSFCVRNTIFSRCPRRSYFLLRQKVTKKTAPGRSVSILYEKISPNRCRGYTQTHCASPLNCTSAEVNDMCNFPTIFSKIISTNCNPSLYGVFCLSRNYVPRKITENPKTKVKSLLSISAAEQ